MVDALVTVAAEAILNKALSIAANEVSIALRYKEKLTELHDTLDVIRAKLSDAEGKKGTEASVMVWLKQLKSVVDKADDVLDEVNYEILRREVKKRYRGNVARKISCCPNLKKFSFGRDMGHKIENINRELSQIYERANYLHLQDEQFEPAGNSYRPDALPYLDEFKIIGREKEKISLVGLLTNLRGEKLAIVPIVGMGGIGKTTLAKSIYNDPKIEQHFDVRAWLCVSVKVEVNTLLADIYESLAGKKVESLMRVNIIRDLQEKLGSKRYLLVLDDVWDEELAYWDDFRNCMLQVKSDHGSGIIVTTRKINIGGNATIEKSYVLESLSDDECWSMFKERALPPLPDFEDIGRDIVKKCCGSPLLVDKLGNMLRHYNTDKGKWLSIQGSEVWDADGRGRVLSILKLSFDNLPNSMVKQCLLYCSIFEKDEVIGREELVQLWMALGLVHTDTETNKEMEDVGNDIFQILVNNSLFQNIEKYEDGDIYGGGIYGCQMHDLVHDLLLSLSSHEISRLVVSDDAQIPAVKHLALQEGDYKNSVFDIFKEDMKKTRSLQTLFFLGGDATNISLKYFKCLRILKLSESSLDEVPDSVGELVHLRYLDLSYTSMRTLPKSIGKLYHLQTLKLLGRSSIEFPQEMRNLISLRHLVYDSRVQAPKDVGLLTSLRTLPSFEVGRQKGRQIEELGHLKHLGGKLRICNLEEIDSKEEALKADLHGKQYLYEIEFHWRRRDEGGNRKDVLEGLQPAANVKSLEIQNYSGNSFPEWAMKMKIKTERNWTPLAKLVKIKLSGCRNCLNIPMLEDLPLLQDLVLENMNKVTCLSSSSDQRKPLSPSLRSLELFGMKNLEKWTHAAVNSSTMLSPLLEKLEIYDCPKIILLDESLQHPLKHLEIRECENLESVRSIQGLTSLQSLDIRNCHSLLEIPDVHNQRCSLKDLTVRNCKKLTCLPGGFDSLALLNELEIGRFSKELHSFPSLSGIEKLGNHLHTLRLYGWEHWESIPEEIKHLTTLRTLLICRFGVRELPMWLTNMSSIRDIRFWECRGLNEESVLQGAPMEATRVYLNGKQIRG